MPSYTSSEGCAIEVNGYEGVFRHNKGTEVVVVKDSLITSFDVAESRAISELIKGGYNERWVTIKSIFIPDLKQNDVIEFNGLKWIVKEIHLGFTPPTLIQTIKGLRYE